MIKKKIKMEKKKNSLIITVLFVVIAIIVGFAILSATKVVNFKEIIKPERGHIDSTVDTKITEILKGNWASFSGYDEESYSCIGDGYSIFTASDKVIMAGKFHTMVSHSIKSVDVLSENRYKINLEPMDDYGDVYIFDTSEINNGILKVPYSETDTENFYTYKLVNKDDVSKDTIFNYYCDWYIKNNSVDTFTNEGNGYGMVTVTGYAYTEERNNSNTGEKYKYVFFKVTESNSNNFMQFLEDGKGNSYVGDKAIGLGCLSNGVISYTNASDEFGNKGVTYKLSASDTKKIINSSAKKTIKIELEKYKLTNGSQGDICTSLISKINVNGTNITNEKLNSSEINELNSFINNTAVMQFVNFTEPAKLLENANSNNKYYLQMILSHSNYALRFEDAGMGGSYIKLDGIKKQLKELTNYDYHDEDVKNYFKDFYKENGQTYFIPVPGGASQVGTVKTGYKVNDKFYVTLSNGIAIVLQKVNNKYYYYSSSGQAANDNLNSSEINELNSFINDTAVMQFVNFTEPAKLLENTNSNNKYYLQMILSHSSYALRFEDAGMGGSYFKLDGIKKQLKELTNYDYRDEDVKNYFNDFYKENEQTYFIPVPGGASQVGTVKTGYKVNDKFYVTLSNGISIVSQKFNNKYYYYSCTGISE